MEEIIKTSKCIRTFLGNRRGLIIRVLGNDMYSIESISGKFKLIGYCKALDEYRTEVGLKKNLILNEKTGKYKETKKLYNHNRDWFSWILEKYELVRTTKPLY